MSTGPSASSTDHVAYKGLGCEQSDSTTIATIAAVRQQPHFMRRNTLFDGGPLGSHIAFLGRTPAVLRKEHQHADPLQQQMHAQVPLAPPNVCQAVL